MELEVYDNATKLELSDICVLVGTEVYDKACASCFAFGYSITGVRRSKLLLFTLDLF